MYQFGSRDGVPMTIPMNLQLCFTYGLAAAKQGDVPTMDTTAYAYNAGIGVEQNYTSAFQWYTKAAGKEQRNAQCNLGLFYEHGRGEVEIDLVQAMHWYNKSAAQEYQPAIDTVERLS